MTFFEHLDELRKRLLWSLAAVFVFTAMGCFLADKALRVLAWPIYKELGPIYFFSPTEAFIIKMKVAFLIGILLSSPVVISQIWQFISPALYEKEKKIFIPLVLITSFLFLFGVFFAYFFVVPFALKFLLGLQTEFLKPMISMENYISFLTSLLISFGIAFNMPVFVTAAVSLGLVSTKFLNKYQRHIIVLIFIAAAVLTPGPDIFSQLMLAIPLLLLFELSILCAKVVEPKKNQKRPVVYEAKT